MALAPVMMINTWGFLTWRVFFYPIPFSWWSTL